MLKLYYTKEFSSDLDSKFDKLINHIAETIGEVCSIDCLQDTGFCVIKFKHYEESTLFVECEYNEEDELEIYYSITTDKEENSKPERIKFL